MNKMISASKQGSSNKLLGKLKSTTPIKASQTPSHESVHSQNNENKSNNMANDLNCSQYTEG